MDLSYLDLNFGGEEIMDDLVQVYDPYLFIYSFDGPLYNTQLVVSSFYVPLSDETSDSGQVNWIREGF